MFVLEKICSMFVTSNQQIVRVKLLLELRKRSVALREELKEKVGNASGATRKQTVYTESVAVKNFLAVVLKLWWNCDKFCNKQEGYSARHEWQETNIFLVGIRETLAWWQEENHTAVAELLAIYWWPVSNVSVSQTEMIKKHLLVYLFNNYIKRETFTPKKYWR